jgi:hypothetical protein
VYDAKSERQEREMILGITLTAAGIVLLIFLSIVVEYMRTSP